MVFGVGPLVPISPNIFLRVWKYRYTFKITFHRLKTNFHLRKSLLLPRWKSNWFSIIHSIIYYDSGYATLFLDNFSCIGIYDLINQVQWTYKNGALSWFDCVVEHSHFVLFSHQLFSLAMGWWNFSQKGHSSFGTYLKENLLVLSSRWEAAVTNDFQLICLLV